MALVCAIFPLIWLGSLVTTHDAGMAVPDWPNTYGYNLLLYPWQTWVYGPWGLFIEHGHRLLGMLVGVIAIGLVASSWWCHSRASVRWLSVAVLAGVIAQGLLGGARVVQDEVQLAKIHGCCAPLVFSLAVATAVVASRRWQEGVSKSDAPLGKIERYAVVTTLLAYCQLVLGSQLRHLPAAAQPGEFRTAVVFHLVVAAALTVHIVLLAFEVFRTQRAERTLVRPTAVLLILIALQLLLGSSTWVTKYGWPGWLGDYGFAAGYTVVADAPVQASVTTAHVAMGSMLLANCVAVALRSMRYARQGRPSAIDQPLWLAEAAR